MSPADSAARAGAMPEASGDSSSGTLEMKKVLAVIVLLPFLLVLSKCAYVHVDHNFAGTRLLGELQKVGLPPGSKVLKQKSEIGGFISGTGDAIDALAYRVFTTTENEGEVFRYFSTRNPRDDNDDDRFECFRLDAPEGSRISVTESILRRELSASTKPSYVVYSAERIDDGIWDWRGW